MPFTKARNYKRFNVGIYYCRGIPRVIMNGELAFSRAKMPGVNVQCN